MRLSRDCRSITIVLVGGVLLAAFAVRAQDVVATTKREASAQRLATPSATAVKKATSPAQRRAGARRGTASRRVSSRQRLARLRLDPGRVREIQQALREAGYLSQEPTGNWDNATRNAMRRYQVDNSFPTTGLPEAKSLLKLGLGPHPLPPELDTADREQTSVSENTTLNTDSSDTETTANRAVPLVTSSQAK